MGIKRLFSMILVGILCFGSLCGCKIIENDYLQKEIKQFSVNTDITLTNINSNYTIYNSSIVIKGEINKIEKLAYFYIEFISSETNEQINMRLNIDKQGIYISVEDYLNFILWNGILDKPLEKNGCIYDKLEEQLYKDNIDYICLFKFDKITLFDMLDNISVFSKLLNLIDVDNVLDVEKNTNIITLDSNNIYLLLNYFLDTFKGTSDTIFYNLEKFIETAITNDIFDIDEKAFLTSFLLEIKNNDDYFYWFDYFYKHLRVNNYYNLNSLTTESLKGSEITKKIFKAKYAYNRSIDSKIFNTDLEVINILINSKFEPSFIEVSELFALSKYIGITEFSDKYIFLLNKENPLQYVKITWESENMGNAFLDESRVEGTNIDICNFVFKENYFYLPLSFLSSKLGEVIKFNDIDNRYSILKNDNEYFLSTVIENNIVYFLVKDLENIGYTINIGDTDFDFLIISR